MLLLVFMKEERFFYVPQATEHCALPQEEAGHAVRVLRLKEGDTIFLIDGMGGIHQAEVTLASNKKCEYRIISSKKCPAPQFPTTIHIAIAPTKMMERMEWMAEKATEIGIDELSFLESQYSERRTMRSDRIEKTVISAMKQSRKAWKPVINDMMPLKDFLDTPREGRKFICHCHNEIPRSDLYKEIHTHKGDASQQNITILIGPEGDFSEEEVQYALEHGYESVSLGESRLRTETAALVALMTIRLGGS
jgi:16S rRNA (uracil1498-N3)-methyltransferase